MPYCSNCGNKVTSEILFCPQCGNKLTIPKAGVKGDKRDDYSTEAEAKKPETIPRGIKKNKLYRQWTEYAGLPPEEIPSTKPPREMPVKGGGNQQYSTVLYILLVIIILMLCTGLAFLFMKS
ncbi:hypothetical protein ES703_104584 [subsurface metagenome]